MVDLNAQESAEATGGGADVKLALATNPIGRSPGVACVGMYSAMLRGSVLLMPSCLSMHLPSVKGSVYTLAASMGKLAIAKPFA